MLSNTQRASPQKEDEMNKKTKRNLESVLWKMPQAEVLFWKPFNEDDL